MLTTGLLPGVGRKKLWITDVYAQPKLTPSPSEPEPPAPAEADGAMGAADSRAVIELVMPAGAKLYVNDVAVEVAEGRNEVPISGLEPDATYEYRLRLESDATADAPASERVVAFAAGDRVVVDLSTVPAVDNVAAVDDAATVDDASGTRIE